MSQKYKLHPSYTKILMVPISGGQAVGYTGQIRRSRENYIYKETLNQQEERWTII